MTLLAVLVGAMVGAPARYLTDLVVRAWQDSHDSCDSGMPWGTVAVNVAGSLVLGLTAGALGGRSDDHWLLLLVGTGFCGALTTFSAFSFETVRLLQVAHPRTAALNVTASVAGGLAACAAGFAVGAALA